MICKIHGVAYSIHWSRTVPNEVYLRYGLFTTSAPRSRNHETSKIEPGLSVYPARLGENKTVSLCSDVTVSQQLAGQGRLVFAITGQLVGVGSDGEPTIKGVRLLPYPIDVKTPH